ncbi:anti-sigma factor family protein [Tianweitania sediminis]|uniref:Anti-sigma factor n=1 Tax=Tianweitania sediminis TaxID=1502156 RepID=A0A8J7UGY5_9HYPH|nr:anti-sigma factor [Tianweitania sediminis]MBP0438649.1 anti-sigma factor [Tianweitania sediminis]HEV7415634.1 anti-sigma factor [Tianweitania sediminis]
MTAPVTISEEELNAYFDSELPAARRDSVEAWLATDPQGMARLEAWERQAEDLRAAFNPILGEPVPARFPRASQARRMRRLGRWAAIAASVAIAFAAGFGTARISAPDGTAGGNDLARFGLSAHATYVSEIRHPVEVVAAEEAHLVKWLSNRLGAPLVVPDLSADGLALIGGRLLPAGGKPGAMLMYETRSGERFSLLVTPGSAKSETAFRYEEEDGFGSFYWYSGDFGYVLVGPADRARLLHLSREVYDALT